MRLRRRATVDRLLDDRGERLCAGAVGSWRAGWRHESSAQLLDDLFSCDRVSRGISEVDRGPRKTARRTPIVMTPRAVAIDEGLMSRFRCARDGLRLQRAGREHERQAGADGSTEPDVHTP